RFADDVAGSFVVSQPEVHRMAQLAVVGPFRELDLCDEIRFYPVRRLVRLDGARERRLLRLALLQQRRNPLELLLIESGAGVADVDEFAVLVDAEQQRAEVRARLPRLGPAPDNELLFVKQLDLAPRRTAPPRLVERGGFLRDEAFPSLFLRARVQRTRVADDL